MSVVNVSIAADSQLGVHLLHLTHRDFVPGFTTIEVAGVLHDESLIEKRHGKRYWRNEALEEPLDRNPEVTLPRTTLRLLQRSRRKKNLIEIAPAAISIASRVRKHYKRQGHDQRRPAPTSSLPQCQKLPTRDD